MDTKILKLDDVPLNILILFSLLAAVDSANSDPQREVVSIYNDNFTTPESRIPYFIEVYRCVLAGPDDNCRSKYNESYPVPVAKEPFEIVVPDLSNTYRDGNKPQFYRYVVYNHTSCKCGSFIEWKLNNTMHKKIPNNTVLEGDFKAKYPNNETNLLSDCNNRNRPQPRYKLVENHHNAAPEFKYLPFIQCLPGSVAKSYTFNVTIALRTNGNGTERITNDTKCVPYDAGNYRIALDSRNSRDAQEEVVSIYNDNFTTPESRMPYFIKVHRCVLSDVNCPTPSYPVPILTKMDKIEIVVPDLTNNDRDPAKKQKFYRYVVYNHTSCKCGKLTERKLFNKTISGGEVSEDDFRANYQAKNPLNLLSDCNYCDRPQPRYKLVENHFNVLGSKSKYLAYKQCLPGCVVMKQKPFNKTIRYTTNNSKNVSLTTDTKCEVYDARKCSDAANCRTPLPL